MITLDSPVEAVLGDPASKQAQGHRRGARAAHRRRPAAPLPASLRRDRPSSPRSRDLRRRPGADPRRRDRAQPGQDLHRPPHRPAGVPPRDGAAHRRRRPRHDVLRQDAGHRREWNAAQAAPRAGAGSSPARSAGSAAAGSSTNPQMRAVRRRRRGPTPTLSLQSAAAASTRSTPSPRASTRGTSSASVAFALTGRRRGARRAARPTSASGTTCSTSRTALELDPRPGRRTPRSPAAQRRFRFEEALVTQLVLARRRARRPRGSGAQARTGGGGLLAAFDAAAAVRAHRRASARSASRSPTSWPRRTR